MIIIGLENVVVLTKSVVSTPVHLDVKVRVAQGNKTHTVKCVLLYLMPLQSFIKNVLNASLNK